MSKTVKVYLCYKCDREFHTKHNATRHSKNKVSCDLHCCKCDIQFITKKRFREHPCYHNNGNKELPGNLLHPLGKLVINEPKFELMLKNLIPKMLEFKNDPEELVRILTTHIYCNPNLIEYHSAYASHATNAENWWVVTEGIDKNQRIFARMTSKSAIKRLGKVLILCFEWCLQQAGSKIFEVTPTEFLNQYDRLEASVSRVPTEPTSHNIETYIKNLSYNIWRHLQSLNGIKTVHSVLVSHRELIYQTKKRFEIFKN